MVGHLIYMEAHLCLKIIANNERTVNYVRAQTQRLGEFYTKLFSSSLGESPGTAKCQLLMGAALTLHLIPLLWTLTLCPVTRGGTD
jgi:hypothetical protein